VHAPPAEPHDGAVGGGVGGGVVDPPEVPDEPPLVLPVDGAEVPVVGFGDVDPLEEVCVEGIAVFDEPVLPLTGDVPDTVPSVVWLDCSFIPLAKFVLFGGRTCPDEIPFGGILVAFCVSLGRTHIPKTIIVADEITNDPIQNATIVFSFMTLKTPLSVYYSFLHHFL